MNEQFSVKHTACPWVCVCVCEHEVKVGRWALKHGPFALICCCRRSGLPVTRWEEQPWPILGCGPASLNTDRENENTSSWCLSVRQHSLSIILSHVSAVFWLINDFSVHYVSLTRSSSSTWAQRLLCQVWEGTVSLTIPHISQNSRLHAANMADLQLTCDAIWVPVHTKAMKISIQLRSCSEY